MLNWKTQLSFRGMISLFRATILPEGFCANSLNGDMGSSSQASPTKGYSEFGHQSNPNDVIVRKFTYTRGDGTEVMFQVRDNNTNYIVEYLNVEDTRNDPNGEWSILETLLRSNTLYDGTVQKAYFGFAAVNQTGSNQLVYGNGTSNGLRLWTAGIGKVASSTATTVTLNGSQTAALRGFKASGSIVINGNTYTYSGLSTNQFTGVSPDPTGEAVGSGIAQASDTSTLSGADKGSILLTSQTRLFVSGTTATPNQVSFSKIADITSYADTGVPSSGGFEDFPELNGPVLALADLDIWIVVFSAKKVLAFSFTYPTSTTRVVVMKEVANEGCASPKAVRKVGNKIVYLTPAGGIKIIDHIEDMNVFSVQDWTEEIRPTIVNFDWSDGALEYITNLRLIVASGRSTSGLTANDSGILIYFSKDEQMNEVRNIGIHDWFIADMTIYKNNMHFGSSLASRNFLAYDGYSKNGAPMNWIRTERVEDFGNYWEKNDTRFLGVRGQIASGAKATFSLQYSTNGSVTLQQMEVKGDDQRFVTLQPLNLIGAFSLGTEPLGGTIEGIGDLNPFKVKFELPNIYVEDLQLTMQTSGTGQRVIIDSVGYETQDAEQHDTQDEIKELGITN